MDEGLKKSVHRDEVVEVKMLEAGLRCLDLVA